MRLSRDIAAIVVSLAFFGLVPLYGAPFDGCVESGFFTLVAGCSSWPEFLRGFIFMAAITIIAGHRKPLAAFGLIAVILVIMVGGAALIGTGEEAAYFRANCFAIAEHIINPLLVGALAALFTCLAIAKLLSLGASDVESA